MPASLKTLEMEVTTLNLRKKNGCRFGKSCGSGGFWVRMDRCEWRKAKVPWLFGLLNAYEV